jgi:hypothetical protein
MDEAIELKKFQDEDGKIKSYPAKLSRQLIILKYLAAKFETGKTYTEKEVNQILEEHHTFHDPALLRRRLVEARLMQRTQDGSQYWRVAEE